MSSKWLLDDFDILTSTSTPFDVLLAQTSSEPGHPGGPPVGKFSFFFLLSFSSFSSAAKSTSFLNSFSLYMSTKELEFRPYESFMLPVALQRGMSGYDERTPSNLLLKWSTLFPEMFRTYFGIAFHRLHAVSVNESSLALPALLWCKGYVGILHLYPCRLLQKN